MKTKTWKIITVVLIVVVLLGGILSWIFYFSPEAKQERELQKNYEQAQETLSRLEEEARADVYGGKTPEETLQLFIEALQGEDFELASKYFAVNGPLSQNEWKEKIESGSDGFLTIASKAVPTLGQDQSDTTFWFSVYNNNEEVEQLIEMSFNEFSGVWKIESL